MDFRFCRRETFSWLGTLLLLHAVCGVPSIGQAHVLLNSPNGGEQLQVNQLISVVWTVEIEHDQENWDLFYSTTSANGPWTSIAMDLPVGDPTAGSVHNFDWLVPNTPTNTAWVRVYQDNVDMDWDDVSDQPFTILTPTLGCDFDSDGTCGLADLNALLAVGPIEPGIPVVPGGNDRFDVNSDGVINLDDRDLWLAEAAVVNGLASPYKVADADLNGAVDAADFILWNDHKFLGTLRWDQGDFNGDGLADGRDFIAWNDRKFTSSDRMAAVPEPSSLVIWLGLFGLMTRFPEIRKVPAGRQQMAIVGCKLLLFARHLEGCEPPHRRCRSFRRR